MELKEFIKIALAEITNAIIEAQAEIKNGAVVSPEPDMLNGVPLCQDVAFDVAVAVSTTDNKKKGAALGLNVVGFGIDKNLTNTSDASARISFRIPVSYPVAKKVSPRKGRGRNSPECL